MERRQAQRGFTMLEALTSMALFFSLVAAVLITYGPSRSLYTGGATRAEVQQNARLAMAEMARQIRMAGFFPGNFTIPSPGTTEDDPILIATDSALAVHGDIDGSGATNAFLFCLDGDLLRRGRGAANVTGSFTCDQGDVLAENAAELRFTYYDADGNPIPDPATAPYVLDSQGVGSVPDRSDMTQRSDVRRIVVTLTVQEDLPVQKNYVYTLTSDIWLRNNG
jgi:type II secretory pathway pseudopilin PulG